MPSRVAFRHLSPVLLIIIGAGLATGLAVGLVYNRMVARRNAVDSSWAQIDVAASQAPRSDPAAGRGGEGIRGARTDDVRARLGESQRGGGGDRGRRARHGRAGAQGATGALLGVAESYPQLEASTNFSKLQTQLRETEDQIAITRRVYNDTVETYNTLVQVFPALIVARLFGFAPASSSMPRRPPRRRPRSTSPRSAAGVKRTILAARRRARRALGAVAAPAALAKSYKIIDANVALRLAPNGDLLVTEDLTFDFDGSFEGAYRDIPLLAGRDGSRDVQVSEGDASTSPAATRSSAASTGPGVFGTEDSIDGLRGERDRLALPGRRRGSARSRSPTGSSAARSPTTT